MRFVCLGYADPQQFEPPMPAGVESLVTECLAYDDELRRGGHYVQGFALQNARSAATLRWRETGATITDGPFCETKEQLGGLLILEARDLNHAIQLISQHPGLRFGPFEIRPLDQAFMDLLATRGLNGQSIA